MTARKKPAKKKDRASPRSVRLYPPNDEAWEEYEQYVGSMSFNHAVNVALAPLLGVVVNMAEYKKPRENADDE